MRIEYGLLVLALLWQPVTATEYRLAGLMGSPGELAFIEIDGQAQQRFRIGDVVGDASLAELGERWAKLVRDGETLTLPLKGAPQSFADTAEEPRVSAVKNLVWSAAQIDELEAVTSADADSTAEQRQQALNKALGVPADALLLNVDRKEFDNLDQAIGYLIQSVRDQAVPSVGLAQAGPLEQIYISLER